MITVEITGREQEFNKVACISILCSIARLSLGEAKRIVDSMLEGNVQRVELMSEQDAHRLVEFLGMHGAIGSVQK